MINNSMQVSSCPHVQIYVLSYNRTEFVIECIQSILNQTYSNYDLIVSDNSTSDKVKNLIEQKFQNVKVIQRKPSLPVMSHLNQILNEIQSDFFMLFHDDDILLPEGLETLVNGIMNNSQVVAVAGNAQIISQTKKTKKLIFPTLTKDLILKNPRQLAFQYLNQPHFILPFPSYLYSKKAISSNRFNVQEAGKYSDVTFLIKLIQNGNFLWLAKPVMMYRIHGENDSNQIDFKSILKLCKFIQSQTNLKSNHYLIQKFKLRNWIAHERKNNWISYKKNKKRTLKIIFRYLLLDPLEAFRFLFKKIFKIFLK